MKVESESEVAQSCPTLIDPMDCSLSGCSIHGIFQARVLEWGAIAFSNIYTLLYIKCPSQVLLVVKNLPANAGDMSSVPGLGRSSGIGNGNPLQYSCLGNSMDRGALRAIVHGVTKSQTGLSN